MRPITKVTIPQGVPMDGTDPTVYMPLFSMEEIGAMLPKVQLEKESLLGSAQNSSYPSSQCNFDTTISARACCSVATSPMG